MPVPGRALRVRPASGRGDTESLNAQGMTEGWLGPALCNSGGSSIVIKSHEHFRLIRECAEPLKEFTLVRVGRESANGVYS